MSWVKIEVFLFLLSALLSSRQVSHIKVLIEQQDWCTGELWAARTDRKHFLSGKQIFSLWNMDEWTVSPSDVTWWRADFLLSEAAGGRQEEEHQTRPSIQRAARRRCQVSEQVRMQPRKDEPWCQTGFSCIEVYGRWWRTETERRLNISSLRSSAQTSNQPPIGFNTGETTVWHHDSSLVRQINILTPETLNNLKSVSATRPSTFDLWFLFG